MVGPCWMCAPGKVPNCPYGLSGLIVWTMILQYADNGSHTLFILEYVSGQLKETRTVHLRSCWSVYFRKLFAVVLNDPVDMNSSIRVILTWTVPVTDSRQWTSQKQKQQVSLFFTSNLMLVSFVLSRCEWEVVLSTPQLSHLSACLHIKALEPLLSAIIDRHDVYF